MIRRLEQVAALVVAAGLALVSYWLFFSWARGGGAEHRLPRRSQSSLWRPALRPGLEAIVGSRAEAAAVPAAEAAALADAAGFADRAEFKGRRGP
jgi:hypothetical protein